MLVAKSTPNGHAFLASGALIRHRCIGHAAVPGRAGPISAEIRAYRRDLQHPTARPRITRPPVKVRQLDTGRYELVKGTKRLKMVGAAEAATIPATT